VVEDLVADLGREGLEVVGPEAVGLEVVGPEAVGLEVVGPEAVGLEVVGLEAVDQGEEDRAVVGRAEPVEEQGKALNRASG